MSTSEINWDCEVCYECPEKVYQCVNGHLLCQNCITKVTICPQCRVPLGENKIRNRAVERILDNQTFPCEFKDVGCLETPKRKDASEHSVWCKYQYRLRSLCLHIGFSCDFTSNLSRPQEILQHLQQEHGIHIQKVQKEVTLILKNVSEAILHSKSFWIPAVLKLGSDIQATKFLIVVRFDSADNSLWIGYHFLEDPLKQMETSFSITFCLQANSSKVFDINWTLNPNHFDFASRIGLLLDFPIFRIPISSLKSHYMVDNKLKMIVNVIESGENEKRKKRRRLSAPVLNLLPVKCNVTDKCETFNWKCSNCGLLTIGDKSCYSCLQCQEVLCTKCMVQTNHNHHVFAMLRGLLQRNYMAAVSIDHKSIWNDLLPKIDIPDIGFTTENPFSTECQNCGSYPIMKIMYTCLLCPTRVDYCQTCVDKNVHRRHILGVIRNQEQEEFINSQRKPGSALIPLLANIMNLE